MLVLQERDQFNVAKLTYTRGKDLSGGLEGAGGIGGLLALTSSIENPASSYYFHSDGNGNVTALVDTNQNVVARYLYDPFGNTLSATGPKAALNKYRFSSKEWHVPSGMVYYGYRWYVPELQRWGNRDPLGERGFETLRNGPWEGFDDEANLYVFVLNDAPNRFDARGLAPGDDHRLTPAEEYAAKVGRCLGIAKKRMNEFRDRQRQGRLRANADKWYHCVISCEMTRQCGAAAAKAIGNTHERLHPGGAADTRMDQHANQEGRDCGDCKETRSCEQCCGDKGYSQ